jgi:spore maturation protein CgeB
MYVGYLDSFYARHAGLDGLSYTQHINLLLADTTEFVGSYIRNFRKLGIDADCIISNDHKLQRKWVEENAAFYDKTDGILFSQLKSCKPDILWIEDLNYISPSWLEAVRKQVKSVKLIIAYHCAPFNQKILDNLKGVDFIVTCTPGLKSNFENEGKRSYLIYHGFDSELLSRIKSEAELFENNFIFSGSLITGSDFHNNRIKLIEKILAENIDIHLYVNLENEFRIRAKQSIYLISSFFRRLKMDKFIDNHKIFDHGKTLVTSYSDSLLKSKRPPLYGIDMYKLFLHSKIVLNFHIGVAGDYAGNMRMFEVTGVGSCLLTDNKKNMSSLFNIGNEVVVYDNAEDCTAKVKWLLEHEEERKKIALAGQKKTLNSHTVENRCGSIIEIINNELKTIRN